MGRGSLWNLPPSPSSVLRRFLGLPPAWESEDRTERSQVSCASTAEVVVFRIVCRQEGRSSRSTMHLDVSDKGGSVTLRLARDVQLTRPWSTATVSTTAPSDFMSLLLLSVLPSVFDLRQIYQEQTLSRTVLCTWTCCPVRPRCVMTAVPAVRHAVVPSGRAIRRYHSAPLPFVTVTSLHVVNPRGLHWPTAARAISTSR